MSNERDLHVCAVRSTWPLALSLGHHTPKPQGALEPPISPPVGTLLVEYEVRRFIDVRNMTVVRGYRVIVKQRFSIPNDGNSRLGNGEVTEFTYPVMVRANMALVAGETMKLCHLLEVAPKTINGSVTTNATGTASTQNATSSTVTSGSSMSDVSTFLHSIKVPLTSSTSTRFSSDSRERSSASNKGAASSDSMTVKDWSAYVSIDDGYVSPSWIWAQTFPWDVIQYHYTDAEGYVTLPDAINGLLFPPASGTQKIQLVNPPSALSQFGLDFVMQAEWLYLVDDDHPRDEVTFKHLIAPYVGTHGVHSLPNADDPPKEDGPLVPFVRLVQRPEEQFEVTSPVLDLALLALDPVIVGESVATAMVGFVLSKFITRPSHSGGFCINSAANNLVVRGDSANGFTDPVGNDAPMTADLSAQGSSAVMMLFFKMLDEDADCTLYLKHWKLAPIGVRLAIIINDNPAIIRCVDALEAGSGSDNVSSVFLRRRRFSAEEYYDYLVPGLNKLTITATQDSEVNRLASGGPLQCGYAIRALAIS